MARCAHSVSECWAWLFRLFLLSLSAHFAGFACVAFCQCAPLAYLFVFAAFSTFRALMTDCVFQAWAASALCEGLLTRRADQAFSALSVYFAFTFSRNLVVFISAVITLLKFGITSFSTYFSHEASFFSISAMQANGVFTIFSDIIMSSAAFFLPFSRWTFTTVWAFSVIFSIMMTSACDLLAIVTVTTLWTLWILNYFTFIWQIFSRLTFCTGFEFCIFS